MGLKLITFAVPCYNAAAYMNKCIESLLEGGEEIEIIIVDDGSTDETGSIADGYAARYPELIRVIHQENSGHGEGVNQGLRNAAGLYYKVVDSDDWVDSDSLKLVIEKLKEFAAMGEPVDMLITNYVYEHVSENTRNVQQYRWTFPENRVFSWNEVGFFKPQQYLLMHSIIYRTQILRGCGLELPKHTFYVDNIFVYQPLPDVNRMYYLNTDFYRYFIGRPDQSVNEKVMIKRVNQQLKVTRIMIEAYDLEELRKIEPKLGSYMLRYLSLMMAMSTLLLSIDGSYKAILKQMALWSFLKKNNPVTYRKIKYSSLGGMTKMPGRMGRKITVNAYRIVRRIYKFN
ncbi:MAG: glycosyltransferase family 2 protein [Clostridiaceae bacterium]